MDFEREVDAFMKARLEQREPFQRFATGLGPKDEQSQLDFALSLLNAVHAVHREALLKVAREIERLRQEVAKLTDDG